MKINIDRCKVSKMSLRELNDYLRDRGLDTAKEVKQYQCPTKCYDYIFVGESLADKVVGCIKTVIGLVPIIEPWETAGA